ncbi:ATP-binding cassette domain-containing protein [Streptomyces sp. WMMC500]|uniref:ATP-binding cassette domain-containing protein n=1 Tax=Streptomyces sp. WMMC500 TaxID=3015154 RepID=UPI00248C16A9|nr:ATP-binding cassette domain-containing protein [Streptomyces sp. WMMC500]WBB58376.1 ATP-binding cassette domain-containing protein [Streptomyces sp. WMMC500]
MTAILAEGLRKTYGRKGAAKAALAGLDLAVPAGTVHAVLGPNGAGKTTAVRILATLLRPDAGTARVAGHDAVREPDEVRYRIGLLGQHAAVDEVLSGRQNLELFGRLYHLGRAGARRRAATLLARFGLDDTGDKPVGQYSGGMRRRLDLAASLLMRPQVLFLDEPTTGLDPRGRTEVWQAVRSLVGDGTTVLLTTQYLEEADQLADRVSVVDHGRVVADGTSDELKALLGGDRIDVVVRDADRLDAAAAVIGMAARAGEADIEVDADARRISAPVADRMAALAETVAGLGAAGVAAEDVSLRRPTLDEVFLHLTGRRQEQEQPQEREQGRAQGQTGHAAGGAGDARAAAEGSAV